jgi:aminopeptidase N
MPGKIESWAAANLPEGSRGGAKRSISQIAVRKAVADRLKPAVEAWLAR